MKDLMGQEIRVGDKVAYSVNSFKGYLGLGTVVEVIPETKHPREAGRVVPARLKVEVFASSNYAGEQPKKVITLGNAFNRAYNPGSPIDTVFVYESVDRRG